MNQKIEITPMGVMHIDNHGMNLTYILMRSQAIVDDKVAIDNLFWLINNSAYGFEDIIPKLKNYSCAETYAKSIKLQAYIIEQIKAELKIESNESIKTEN